MADGKNDVVSRSRTCQRAWEGGPGALVLLAHHMFMVIHLVRQRTMCLRYQYFIQIPRTQSIKNKQFRQSVPW